MQYLPKIADIFTPIVIYRFIVVKIFPHNRLKLNVVIDFTNVNLPSHTLSIVPTYRTSTPTIMMETVLEPHPCVKQKSILLS